MPARLRSPLTGAVAGLTVVLVLAFGIWWGAHPSSLPGFLRDTLAGGSTSAVLDESVQRIIDDYYVPVKRSDLVNGSISGIVASLHDRFSNYLSPREYHDFVTSAAQQFSGVGTNVVGAKRGLRVIEVFDASPAARAGIVAGDTILGADGHSLAGLSEAAATALVKGKPGTQVDLRILHQGRTRTVRVTRAEVSVPVVASKLRTVGGRKVADVGLATFSSGAHGEVRAAVDKLIHQGARAVILDLRHNGGGLVEEARLVASIFVPDGPIVTTRGRTQPTITLTAAGDAIPRSIPVAVLVDRDTASAAEIVAGALQDRHRATIVGTHTFGKGVFQEVRPLSNGGALDITVGEYFLPSGRNLGGGGIKRGAGISPDVAVSAAPTSTRDPALDAALHAVAAKLR
ncbi:MAG: carboxyl-terminal processing protease [Solirubrobacteraceae bacterium]|nr:carboxyl-terminal processing protease [Solirubrobacteraceae bacterium]